MRIIYESSQTYRSRPRRQDVLSLRHGLLRNNGICRECRNDFPFTQLNSRPQATLCPACIEARLERLAADAL